MMKTFCKQFISLAQLFDLYWKQQKVAFLQLLGYMYLVKSDDQNLFGVNAI